MEKKSKPYQGEILLMLVNRSNLSKQDVASALNIHRGHLSKLFKSENLSLKIRKSVEAIFGVSESVWESSSLSELPMVTEPSINYAVSSPRHVDVTPASLLEYLEEMDHRHYLERHEQQERHSKEKDRLLTIIENLTKQ